MLSIIIRPTCMTLNFETTVPVFLKLAVLITLLCVNYFNYSPDISQRQHKQSPSCPYPCHCLGAPRNVAVEIYVSLEVPFTEVKLSCPYNNKVPRPNHNLRYKNSKSRQPNIYPMEKVLILNAYCMI